MKRRISAMLLLWILLQSPQSFAGADFKSYFRGDNDSPQIAITVDDLYRLENLETILDLCQTYDISMTFFALGAVIKPEDAPLWQRIVTEGHEIGNHTYRHANITTLTTYQLTRELTRTQEALNSVLSEPYTMRLFRPPYGRYDRTGRSNTEVLGSLGYHYVIRWCVDSTDADKAFKATKNGSILLFHTNPKDVQCLTELIPRLLDAGFEPVTISELLNLPPMECETGDA